MSQVKNSYEYTGDVQELLSGVKRACENMSLQIKNEIILPNGFNIVASQRMNWLSTNWPLKFKITTERKGGMYTLLVSGSSLMGSLTQSSNNKLEIEKLLSAIKSQCSSK